MSDPENFINAVEETADCCNAAVTKASDAGVLVKVRLREDPEVMARRPRAGRWWL